MASGNDGWDLWWAMEGQARVEDVVGSNGFNVVCEAHKATTVILSEHVESGLENRRASWLHLGFCYVYLMLHLVCILVLAVCT